MIERNFLNFSSFLISRFSMSSWYHTQYSCTLMPNFWLLFRKNKWHIVSNFEKQFWKSNFLWNFYFLISQEDWKSRLDDDKNELNFLDVKRNQNIFFFFFRTETSFSLIRKRENAICHLNDFFNFTFENAILKKCLYWKMKNVQICICKMFQFL